MKHKKRGTLAATVGGEIVNWMTTTHKTNPKRAVSARYIASSIGKPLHTVNNALKQRLKEDPDLCIEKLLNAGNHRRMNYYWYHTGLRVSKAPEAVTEKAIAPTYAPPAPAPEGSRSQRKQEVEQAMNSLPQYAATLLSAWRQGNLALMKNSLQMISAVVRKVEADMKEDLFARLR